jgi:hypothetical protein
MLAEAHTSKTTSADRILPRKLRKEREVAIARIQPLDSVSQTDRRDPGIVNDRPPHPREPREVTEDLREPFRFTDQPK